MSASFRRARPRPQLADRQRRDRLVAVHEPLELRSIEAAVAVPDELERHRVDPRVASPSILRQRRQLAIVGAREIVVDGADLRGDEMEMIQQPFCGLLDALTPNAMMSLARRVIRDRRALTSVEHDVRGAYERVDRSPGGGATMTRDPRIIIVGAGVAGIATAVTLQRKGFHDFTILEKGADVGGVWHWNHYPGLTCDVPSQLYQFSFAPKPDWTGIFAPGDEIQRYLRGVVERFRLEDRMRLNSEVTSTVFDGTSGGSPPRTAQNWKRTSSIAATGVLHHAFIPDIPGLDSFDGDVVHTARWDDLIETSGRSIAVIGNGSTGVQIVSALQRDATHITHFVRTPQWVMWAPIRTAATRCVERDPAQAADRQSPAVRRDTLGFRDFGRYHHAAVVAPSAHTELRAWCLRVQIRDVELRDASRRITSRCASARSSRTRTTGQSRRTTPNWSRRPSNGHPAAASKPPTVAKPQSIW